MAIKIILPHGGYGLGNDLIPWAKAYILAQELGAKLLHPAWGNNSRKYYKYFRTFRYDYQLYRVLRRTLPRYRFTEEDYRDIGINDFSEASKVFASEYGLHRKKNYIVEVTGFWGGLSGLETAKDYVLSSLLNTAHTQRNLFAINKAIHRDKLTIGLHVRLGDFFQAGKEFVYSGVERTSIPIEWYCSVCDSIETSLGAENVQFVICSDGHRDALSRLVDRDTTIFLSEMPNSDISDLIALIKADILICSISSYSMWAAFLSKSPYIWYRPNLVKSDDALVNRFIRSLGVYPLKQAAGNLVTGRGVALDLTDPLPDYLLANLRILLVNKLVRHDLVRGGSAP